MTNMRRVTVSFPDDIDKAVLELKEKEPFCNYPYSKLIRHLVKHGLDLLRAEAKDSA